MTKEISNKIKFYNLILIVLIFMYHSDGKYYLRIGPYLEVLGTMGLAFFFMISAFFMFANLNEDNVKKQVGKRFKTILLPYLFWNVLFYGVFAISDIYIRQTPFRTVLYRIAFQPYNEVLWYLSALFIFSMLSLPLYYLLRKKWRAIAFLVITSGLVVFFLIYRAESVVSAFELGWWIVKIFKYLPIYFLGAYVGFFHKDRLSIRFPYSVIFFVLTLVCLVVMYKLDYIGPLYWAMWVISPIMAWFALPESIFKKSKVLDFLCEPSFFMYEFQLLDFWIWQWVFANVIHGEKAFNLTVLGVSFVFTYVLYYLLKLVAPPVLSVATGFRSERKK